MTQPHYISLTFLGTVHAPISRLKRHERDSCVSPAYEVDSGTALGIANVLTVLFFRAVWLMFILIGPGPPPHDDVCPGWSGQVR